MHVISAHSSINIIVSVTDAELIVSAFRDLNARHEADRTMTPKLKDKIVTAIMLIEGVVAAMKMTPDPDQKVYDSIP